MPVRSFHDDALEDRQRVVDVEPASESGRPSAELIQVVLAVKPVPIGAVFVARVQTALPTARTSQQQFRHFVQSHVQSIESTDGP